jgi:hypothetical protein
MADTCTTSSGFRSSSGCDQGVIGILRHACAGLYVKQAAFVPPFLDNSSQGNLGSLDTVLCKSLEEFRCGADTGALLGSAVFLLAHGRRSVALILTFHELKGRPWSSSLPAPRGPNFSSRLLGAHLTSSIFGQFTTNQVPVLNGGREAAAELGPVGTTNG